MWQMQEEEERRDAIRRDIRVEYERQRLQERELWEQMNENHRRRHASFYSDYSSHREQQDGFVRESSFSSSVDGRRCKLVAEKRQLSADIQKAIRRTQSEQDSPMEDLSSSSSSSSSTTTPNVLQTIEPLRKDDAHNHKDRPMHPQQRLLRMPFPPKPIPRARTRCLKKSVASLSSSLGRRVRSVPVVSSTVRRLVPSTPKPSSPSVSTTTVTSSRSSSIRSNHSQEPSIEVMAEDSATRCRRTVSLSETMIVCLLDKDSAVNAGVDEEEEENSSLEDIPLQ